MTKAPTAANESGAFEEQGELFEPPPFSATAPHRNTIAARALALLADSRMLTHPEFEALTNSWRLAAPVCELKKLGWPIKTLKIPAPTAETPSRYIAVYCLESKAKAMAQEVTR